MDQVQLYDHALNQFYVANGAYIYKVLIVIYSITIRPTVPVFAFQDCRSLHLKPQ